MRASQRAYIHVLYGVMGTAFVSSVENSLDRKISCALDKNFFFSFSLFLVWFYGGRIVGKIELKSDAEIGTSLARVSDYIINYYTKTITV